MVFLMNLDDHKNFNQIDKSNMLREIKNLPDQLEQAWISSEKYPLPRQQNYKHIIISGMGGSAIGADILLSYIKDLSPIPLTIVRGYELPAWALNEQVLVICSSHSGNTEETISVLNQANKNKCTTVSISTGGQLYEINKAHGGIAWRFNHVGQPRTAVGYSFGILMNLFYRMGWIKDPLDSLKKTVKEMKALEIKINDSIPANQNIAKRLAGQAIDRFPIIFSAGHLEPIGRRWKTQINELSKSISGFEFIPEADHNTLAGLINPDSSQHKFYTIFLDSDYYLPQNKKRIQLTATEFMVAGFCTDIVKTESSNILSEIWNLILLGDFVSYYLAMAYEVDPTPVEALEDFKRAL